MFKETPAGAPEAVKAWFYPGETTGYEFVYPHDQALKIAKATHSSVLTAKGEVTGTTLATDTTRVDENDRVLSADERLKDSGKQAATTSTTTSTTTASTTTASTTTAAAAAPVTPPPPETTTTTTTTTAAAATPAPAPAPAPMPTPEPPASTTAQAVQPPATVAPQPVTTPRGTTITEPTPVATSGQTESPRRSLPKTASPLPLFELLSGLSIAGGFALRAVRKARA
jgi:hypothetical protein